MAKRKTTTPRAGSRAKKSSSRVARTTGRKAAGAAGKTRRTGGRKPAGRKTAAGRSSPARATTAKGSAARQRNVGRQRKPARGPQDVTADVQRRWDLEEEDVPTPPSTLDLDRHASAARTGRSELQQRRKQHHAANDVITGGDVDANWEEAYFVGDEAATGDNPTPDQAVVEDVGKAVGLEYEDTEELKASEKVDKRDRKRWELDPASSEDYKERNKRRRS